MKKLNIGPSNIHLNGWINMEYDEEYWLTAKKNNKDNELKWGTPIDDGKIATRDYPDCFGDVSNLPFSDNTFDEVRSSHVMEHISTKLTHKGFREQFRVLKSGGWIRVIVPSFDILLERFINKEKYQEFWDKTMNDKGLWWESELKQPCGTIDEALFAILYLNGEHKYFFSKDSLTAILERVGFVDVQSADVDEEGIPDSTVIDYSLRLKAMKP